MRFFIDEHKPNKTYYMKTTLAAVLFILPVLLLCVSCNQNEIKKNQTAESITIHVDPTQTNKISDLTTLITDIKFVLLETTVSNLLDYVNRLWVTDSTYIILSRNFELHVYNHQGHFKFKKTPVKEKNEILWLHNFSPGANGHLFILDHKKYHSISKNGHYLSSVPLVLPFEGFNPTEFHIISDTFLLYSTNAAKQTVTSLETFSLCLYNTITKKHKLFYRRQTCNVSENVFFQCNNQLLIAPPLGIDSIYTWKNNTVMPMYYIDFGAYKCNVEILPKNFESPFPAFSYATTNKKCILITGTLMNDDWLRFNYLFHKSFYEIFIHRTNKQNIIIDLNKTNTKNLLFISPRLAVYDDYFIASIPAYKIAEMLAKNTINLSFLSKKRQIELFDQLKTLKETDNPVLMFVKLKKSNAF